MKQANLNEYAKGDKPDLKGSLEVAAWFNVDKDGKTFLSVKLGDRIKLVPTEDKRELGLK